MYVHLNIQAFSRAYGTLSHIYKQLSATGAELMESAHEALIGALRSTREQADSVLKELRTVPSGTRYRGMLRLRAYQTFCASNSRRSGALIILKPKNELWPSNLQGIVYCNYDKSLRRGLEDQAGFRAALRTRIPSVAKERRMIA